jgi:hypothetical protein
MYSILHCASACTCGPYAAHNPSVKTVEELTDVGLAIIISPSANDRVDLVNQFLCRNGSLPARSCAYLLLEVSH